jgi:transcriptional regulator of acetoin/glycerol metabolism
LLDRLSFEVVTLPPLRARSGDIPLLAEHFGRRMAVELDWPNWPGFSPQAQAALEAYAWPGNVRELRNVIRTALAICDGGVVRLGDLPSELRAEDPMPAEPGPPATSTVRDDLLRCMRECDGNMSLTAKRLGISRNTLYRRCKRLDIELPRSHNLLA